MKKLVTLVILVIAMCTFSNAQNYEVINITSQFEFGIHYQYCATIDSIVINQDGTCQNLATWLVGNDQTGALIFEGSANHISITPDMGEQIAIYYTDCLVTLKWFIIDFTDFENMPEPWTENTRWLAPGETLELDAYYSENLSYLWQDNSTDWRYFVTGPETSGKIWVRMYNDCGELSDTINVYYGEGVYRATVDLETHLNKVTWTTTPKQTEYISEVKVYRDGMLVGTVPYEQGYFLDNIGSDNAARNYHLVSVTPNGEESPASAPKGTIHTTYYLDVNDNLNMTWNIPYGTQGTLTYFQICKYDSNTGDLTVVDQVNSSITDYTCGVNQFEGGYPVIAAVFNDDRNREFEDLSFSNMYTDIAIQPQEITISLEPGWTWFSYPYAVSKTLDEALFGFTPMSGDIIVSQSGGTTSFVNGRWRGALTQFTPGLGYMYYSSRSESAPLVFDLSSSRARVKP